MSRQKQARHFPEGFEATEEERRFGTPIEVARYRAERLACGVILEIGCGVGFQTKFLAETCKKVIAVDIVHERVERARRNVQEENVEFYTADALDPDFIARLPAVDAVLCDPGRPSHERERKRSSLSPSMEELCKHYPNLAYEIPPFLEDIPKDAEREFMTLFGKLNRCTLYFGTCKRYPISVVDVPSGERITTTKQTPPKQDPIYIGEVNQAILRAGLLTSLAVQLHAEPYTGEKKGLLFTADPQHSAFVRWYEVVTEGTKVPGTDIVLHYPIPQGHYQQEKRHFTPLGPDRPIHIFKVHDHLLACVRADTGRDRERDG